MPKNKLMYKAMPYLKNFKCTCGDCPDSCCIGWDVDIDQTTYERYMALKEPHLVKRYQKLIKPYPYYFDTAVDFARVKLPHSKRCPFLTEKGLCVTQSELGEGYLSNVCATFPRISNRINDAIETTLTLSCPVAAHLVLLTDTPLVLEETEPPSRQIINLSINTTERRFKQHPVKYFDLIRETSLDIIQREGFDFSEKLFALGLFFETISECQATGDLKEIPLLCETPHESYFSQPLKTDFFEEKIANALSAQFLDTSLELLNVYQTIDSKSFIQYTRNIENQWKKGKNAKKIDPEALGLSRSIYLKAFGKARSRIMTRYAVNYIVKNCFPFVDSEVLMEAYGMLVIRTALIDLYGASLASNEGLTEIAFVNLIQSFAKAVEHHKIFSEGILSHFQKNDWFNLMLLGQLFIYPLSE